jgi:molecular chaperone DnaK (HSP70)
MTEILQQPFSVGIDLGTTYSCVAIYRNGKVEIVPDDNENRTIPSLVGFDKNGMKLIGKDVEKITNPSNLIYEVKRLMGKRFSRISKKELQYTIKEDEQDRPLICINNETLSLSYHPEEISSMILQKIKSMVEKYTNQSFTKCVITVPAYFGESERQATKNAAKLAGLDVLRLINEPTASSLAYGIGKTVTCSKEYILCFDFGGGTHDVTILCIENGVFEVLATSGDSHLGGADMDNILYNYIIEDIYTKFPDEKITPEMQKQIRHSSEKIKCILSDTFDVTYCFYDLLSCDEKSNLYSYSISITREKFEELCQPLFEKLMKPVEMVLADSGLKKHQIDKVIMIGGSTRIPKVRSLLTNFFNRRITLDTSVDPDEAVAYGAAIQAHILECKDDVTDDIVLVDVCSLSLGVKTTGGIMTKIIQRNTTLPTKNTMLFTTSIDFQTKVNISVYEGERAHVKDCLFLGEFQVDGITPLPRGVAQIVVTFYLDLDGMLHISAMDKGTKSSGEMTVCANMLSSMSTEEVEKTLSISAEHEYEDKQFLSLFEAASKFDGKLERMKTLCDNFERMKPAYEEYKQWAIETENPTRLQLTEKIFEISKFIHDFMKEQNRLDELKQQQEQQQEQEQEEEKEEQEKVEEVQDDDILQTTELITTTL